jgi:hypothetical protein
MSADDIDIVMRDAPGGQVGAPRLPMMAPPGG